MTVTVTEPPAISVTATSESEYAVSIASPSTLSVTVSIPNKGDKGDQGDPGIFIPVGVDKDIQFNDGGVLGADTHLKWDKNTRTLRLGIEDDNPLPNNPLACVGAINSYLQVAVRNTTEGDTASSDFVATADNGDDENFYIDIGINSSIYNVPEYSATVANDAYVYTKGNDLVFVAAETGKHVKIAAGGTTSANIVAKFGADALVLPDGYSVTNRPEVFYGTGSPPSAVGLADGTLFFKYEV